MSSLASSSSTSAAGAATTSTPVTGIVGKTEDGNCTFFDTSGDDPRNEVGTEDLKLLTEVTNTSVRRPHNPPSEGVKQPQESFQSESEIASPRTLAPSAVSLDKDVEFDVPPPSVFDGEKDVAASSQNDDLSPTEVTDCLNLKISEVVTLSKDAKEIAENDVFNAQSSSDCDDRGNACESSCLAKHPLVSSKEIAATAELCTGLQSDDNNLDTTTGSENECDGNVSFSQETSDLTIKISEVTTLSKDIHDTLVAENECLIVSESTDNSGSNNYDAVRSSCPSKEPVLSTELSSVSQLVGEKSDNSLPTKDENVTNTNTATNEISVMKYTSSESNLATAVTKSNGMTVITTNNCVPVSTPGKTCIATQNNDTEPVTVSSSVHNENNMESQRSSLTDYLPIILDVRGNANDMVDGINDVNNSEMNNGNDSSAVETNHGSLNLESYPYPTLLQSAASKLLQKYSEEVTANALSQPPPIISRASTSMDNLPKPPVIHAAAVRLVPTTSSQNNNENVRNHSVPGIVTLSNPNGSTIRCSVVDPYSQSPNESSPLSLPLPRSTAPVNVISISCNGQQVLSSMNIRNTFQTSSTHNSHNPNSSQSHPLVASGCPPIVTSHLSSTHDQPQTSPEKLSVSGTFSFYDIKTDYAMGREEIMDRRFLDIELGKRLDLSKEFYCKVCGDEFHTEEFYNLHLNRKIFNLNYYCRFCQKFVVFSNKCMFWQHLKNETWQSRKRLDIEKTMMVMKAFFPSASTTTFNCTPPLIESLPAPAQTEVTNEAQGTAEACVDISRNVPTSTESVHETSEATNLPKEAVDVPAPTDVVSVPTEAVRVSAVRLVSVLSTAPSECLNQKHGPHSNSATNTNEMERVSVSTPTGVAPASVASLATVAQSHTSTSTFCSSSTPPSLSSSPPLSLSSSSEMVAGKENTSFPKTCPFCRKDFPTQPEWTAHFKRTSYNTYHCNVCEMVMFNLCSYSAHKSIHTMQEKRRSMVCPECGESLHLSSDLKHVFEHLDACCHFNLWYKLKCRCGVVLHSDNKAKDHLIQHHLNPIVSCYDCGQRVTSLRALVLHCNMKKHSNAGVHEKIIYCGLCGGHFESPSSVQKHIEEKMNHINVMTRNKVYLCYLCQYSGKDASTLNEHVESEHAHKPKRCTLCFTLFKSRQKLVTHIISKECTRTFPKQFHQCADDVSERETSFDNSQYSRIFTIAEGNPALSLSTDITNCQINVPTSTPSNGQRGKHINVTAANKTSPTPTNKERSQVLKITKPSPLNRSDNRALFSKSPATETVRRKFQCHLCKICLNGLKNYEKHMSHHPSSELQTSRTHCVVCKKMVDGSNITAHMKVHQEAGIIVCVLCHRRDFPSVQLASDHAKNWCYYTEVIGWGEDILKGREKERRISVQNDTQIGTDDANMDVSNENVSQPEKDSNETAEALVFPCLICGLAFTTKSAKADHVSRVHDGTRILFICLLCKKRSLRKEFHKRHKACLHIMRKHRIVAPAEVSKLIGEEEQNISNGEVIHSKSSSHDAVDGAPPPKRLRLQCEGSYLCGRCGFADASNEVFAQHIKTHNPRGEPQCLECGLCFTVVAALKRHLFAVHKIKNMDSYLKEKGIDEDVQEEQVSEDEEIMDSSQSGVNVDAIPSNETKPRPVERPIEDAVHMYECKVCYRKYACEETLQSHMRNHGMAFIRSRRRTLANKT